MQQTEIGAECSTEGCLAVEWCQLHCSFMCLSFSPSWYPSNILVAGIPIPLVERKGFTYTLGRGFYSLAVPLSLFLNSKRNKTQNPVSSGSAPASSLFLGWHWNSTFLFCFMHFPSCLKSILVQGIFFFPSSSLLSSLSSCDFLPLCCFSPLSFAAAAKTENYRQKTKRKREITKKNCHMAHLATTKHTTI